MLGGGEYSFLDLIFHLPQSWKCVAVVPRNGEMADRLQGKGITTHTIALPPIRPLKIFLILATIKLFIRLYRRYRPSLIYINGSRAAVYGGLVGRMFNLPVVWHCRIAECDPHLDPLLVRLSNRIVVNSKATADRFQGRIQQKVTVIYNGVDIEWLQNNSIQKPAIIRDDWKVILAVARASRWKRHDLILAAFELVAQWHPEAHLFCIGDRDQSDPQWWAYLQKRTIQSECSERIHWIGPVEDVRPWYGASLLLVLASENEPFGRVIVEAMATGVVVIASQSGGIPEIVRSGKDGLLVSPGDVRQMADAMSSVLKNESLRKHLVSGARDRAKSFDLMNHVRNMVQTFDEIAL
jgi:glycosyltransferase involved in cell wall biosynthesis